MLALKRVFITIVLGFSVLPFLLGVGVCYDLITLPGYTDFLRGYSAVFVLFLTGLRCNDLCKQTGRHSFVLFASLIGILAAGSLFVTDFYQNLLLQLGCLLALLVMELRLRDLGQVERWYFSLRFWTSLLISFCLLLILTAEI